jgi:hypothetical protein
MRSSIELNTSSGEETLMVLQVGESEGDVLFRSFVFRDFSAELVSPCRSL